MRIRLFSLDIHEEQVPMPAMQILDASMETVLLHARVKHSAAKP